LWEAVSTFTYCAKTTFPVTFPEIEKGMVWLEPERQQSAITAAA
jgi:hypothetical protein